MKVLIGGLYAGTMILDGAVHKNRPPRSDWLYFLFGHSAVLPHRGLYVTDPTDPSQNPQAALSIAPLLGEGEPVGLLLELNGYCFSYLLVPRARSPLREGLFRPLELCAHSGGGMQVVVLSWEHGGDARSVHLENNAVVPRPTSP